ncbi:intermembrane transport protein PqiB [Chromobacterium violaceum]|uniref:PqiB family protein n=1 Tax=Chromobacterium violaceum TaxID=536 RepID=UPI0005D35824|nr:MlaD family protein [Chromobacterium violaceum]KJH67881.1 mammalian cell entry protein [Chromobacterium violaceum]KMN49286.1 mammalian cell entry protein [Chromobacterium violaceum]KMN88012.1 mammalian cell entry protein [Chromobacterium violaceum]KMN91264.1 mammalian cell entry protein [Chromobacterium violaceum]KMO04379.1 mammalian cell entry protein [Chromobacterium violaceum]
MSSDNPQKPEQDDLPQAVPVRRRRWAPSLVWLIPVVAALIGGWLAVHAVLSRGPTITISFQNAEGIEAGKTRIKYKDVEIGEVTSVKLSPNRQAIVATAQLSKEAADYLAEDSRFWVVRPRVSGGGVSGLGTVLSGSYIGMDIGKSEARKTDFIGLETPPIINADLPGQTFTLRADNLGSLNTGSPVYFRRVPVGQVVGYELDSKGGYVKVAVFINAPYDRFVSANSRFWHASGVDVSLSANGLNVSTQSLAAIALGGIAFETPLADNAGIPLSDRNFILHDSRDRALQNPDREMQPFRLRFRQSLRGLSVGAPVDFRGITIGEVTAIGVQYVPERKDFDMTVDIRTYPSRLDSLSRGGRISGKLSPQALVANGMRAQLRSGNLITGQLYVALDFFRDAPPAKLVVRNGLPELPTISGDLEELQRVLQRIVKKLDAVPFDSIGKEADASLKSLHQTLDSVKKLSDGLNGDAVPQALKTLEQLQQTLEATRQAMRADSPLQQDVRAAAQEVKETARSFRALADYLDRHPEALVRGKEAQP